MAGSVHGGDARARTDDVRRLVRHTRVAVAGLGYPYRLAAAASWSSLPFLTLIRQPVLVMGGGDPIVPVPGILATLLPTATTLHVFPGGHVEPLTAATDFGPWIHPIPDRPTTVAVERSELCATHHLPQESTGGPDRNHGEHRTES